MKDGLTHFLGARGAKKLSLVIMQNAPTDAPLKVLLTGAGSIGKRHALNLRELLPSARVAAVCRSADSKIWAHEFGAQIYPSVAAALAFAPELAVVCSASAAHAQDLALLMPSVQALFLEKPLVTDAQALDALRTQLAQGFAKPTVVGCNLRYLPAVQAFKAAIESGQIGRCVQASFRVGQWLPSWRSGRDWRAGYGANRAQGGGVIFDLVHELDSAVHVFGPIARGQAAAGSLSGLGLNADDTASITLLMESGLPVHVGLDYVSRQTVREYIAIGDEGSLHLDLIGKRMQRRDASGVQLVPLADDAFDVAATYRSAMADLLLALQTGSPSRYPLADAIHTTQWMIDLENHAWRRPTQAGVAA
jgi:predicted dehydrogenase